MVRKTRVSQAYAQVLLAVLVLMAGAVAAQAQTWGQVWSEEFNGSGAASSSNWTYETGGGGWGNAELECYTAGTANSSQTGGHLNIQARVQSSCGMPYTSARIKTQGHVSFGPGDAAAVKIEGSLSGPSGQGLWPAFWMLGTNITSVPWPGCGEIDIMEHINSATTAPQTLHWDSGGHASYQYGTINLGSGFGNYNTYAITWTSGLIQGFFNGGSTGGGANIAGNINSTEEFHRSFFILLNLAVGGSWPGNPNSAGVFPANLNVDYIRYYQAGASSTPTPTSAPRATATATSRSRATATATSSARATATATASGCTGTFTNGVDNTGATTARPWFKLCSGTASYVILHYTRPGLSQQNVQMTYNSTAARWEYNVTGMAAGGVLTYSFTYNVGGVQHDSAQFTWTHP
jgi:beta-glucanase (GH16 family)